MKVNEAVLSSRLNGHRARALAYRSLVLLLAVGAYFGGLVAVDALSGDARLPVVVFAVFFLPALLRAWLLAYWLVRKDPRASVDASHEKVI